MQHIERLQRMRNLSLHYLTPEDVVQPVTKPIIVVKTDYSEISSNEGYQPLVPLIKQQRVQTYSRVGRRQERHHFYRRRTLFPDGCPTCGRSHIPVQYFGHRHICNKCKDHICTPDNKPVKFFVDKEERILAYSYEDGYVKAVDPEDLKIFDHRCYASFAGPGEFTCFLYDLTR